MLSFFYCPALTSVHDYWEDQNYMDLCLSKWCLCFLICCLDTYAYCLSLIGIICTIWYVYFYLAVALRTEKAMAPHSSTLAWKIPWTEEPGGPQSMGSLRVGQDWATSLSLFTFCFHALEKEMATHSSVLAWRIPGTGSLVGCRLWGRTESDTTEVT